jgi:two-component system sensor histidine kinase EvgS
VATATQGGAEILIESDEESGTTISLYLTAEPSAAGPLPQISSATRSLTILVADDYPPGRRALQQQLERWGHRVLLAEDGEKALAVWQQHSDIDLLITDCTMPVMDGFTLVEQLRQQERNSGRKAMPILGLTALSGFEMVARCLEAGMNESLTKPLTPQALQVVLQRYFPELNAAELPADGEGDRDAMRKLQENLIEVNVQDGADLQARREAQDREAVSRIAHRIRGGAGLFDQSTLFDACKTVEAACEQQQPWSEIDAYVDALLTDLDKFNDWLNAEIKAKQS